ncbi:helix-turn-helix domain-containing protein [Croceitalea marina]|uniref:Helix-turn-helix domain-containing protein n=1 Tax=Croceitalea marina TaxID=1775166 RepID=A0ABW5MWA4_9FLAO
MDSIQQIIDQIPIRHNLASQLMFLGVVQGFFLSLLLFIRTKNNSAILFLGWSLFFQALVFLDTYLCYTGLIKYGLIFNDSTESFVLMIAPTFYLFIYCAIKREFPVFRKQLPHFIIPLFYAVTQFSFYTAPKSVKLNAYLGAYYDQLETASVPDTFNYNYHWIKDEFDWLILFSFSFYSILVFRLVWKERSRIKEIPHQANLNKYLFTRNSAILLCILLGIIFLVLYNYDDDGGDHYIGMVQTLIAFSTSYVIFMESRFFEKSWFADKYETLKSQTVDFDKIEGYIYSTKYFLSEKANLKELSEKLNSNPNSVSKAINTKEGINFNDYINKKRVEVTKERLLDSNFSHLTIEAIGNSVGFNSKSAFYNAFKKHVGTSPLMFVKGRKHQN